jgi:FixJ family two-component response regulator/putative methionine-R-sulfoxide reductase with GAF domain
VGTQDTIILVVDDEEAVRHSVQEILAPEGLFCRTVASGALALEVAQQIQPGIVLLDTRLPDANSLELMLLLGRVAPGSQIILMAEAVDHDLILDALEKGARDYLGKPLHPRETRLAVRRAIAAWRSGQDGNRLREGVREIVERSESLIARLAGSWEEKRTSLLAEGIVETAAAALGAGKVSLMLLDEPGNWLRVEACTGHSVPAAEMDVVLPGEGVAGFALTLGEPFAVTDASSDYRFSHMVVPERYEGSSFVLAPLIAEGKAFGVLCASESLNGKPFGEEALVLLRLLAQQFAGTRLFAGRRGRLLERPGRLIDLDREPMAVVARDEDWLETLDVLPKTENETDSRRDAELALEICRAATDELDPERTLAGALEALGAGLSASLVSLYLVDSNSSELRLETATVGIGCQDRICLPPNRGLTGSVVETGDARVHSIFATDPEFDSEVDTSLEGASQALLCMPIKIRGKVIGVVRAFLPEQASVSPRTGEVAAAALSAAVRSGLLYRSLVASIEDVAAARREGSA